MVPEPRTDCRRAQAATGPPVIAEGYMGFSKVPEEASAVRQR